MVLCFNCSTETKEILDRLVASGHYRDHSQALAVAVSNLGVLHTALADSGSIILGEDLRPAGGGETLAGKRDTHEVGAKQQTQVATHSDGSRAPVPAASAIGPAIPELFRCRPDAERPAQFAVAKSVRAQQTKLMPIEGWMFGQFNRLLPAKTTCRALINIVADATDRQPLDKVAMEIANAAARLGRYLGELDVRYNLGRDNELAIAFPKGPTSAEFKGIQRYANQFVGSANKEGEISGLPTALKLIGPHPDFTDGIALTEAGWLFGSIVNPLLDGPVRGRVEKFSEGEIAFLVDHILTNVSAEASAYSTILQAVADGALTPDDVDRALIKLSNGGKPNDTFIATQRSGAISRMADLDLIARSRTATRVSYVVTARGREFLKAVGGASMEKAKSA